MTPREAAGRVAVFYGAFFFANGVNLPFWPLWLTARGLTPAEIGWAIAATYLSRLLVNPVAGYVADRRGDRRRPMVVMIVAAFVGWLLFPLTGGFWSIIAVTLLTTGLWSGLIPLGDSLAMLIVQRHGLDYGRIRLWGSLCFIVSAVATGWWLTKMPATTLVWLIAGGLALTAWSSYRLPDERLPAAPGGKPAPVWPLLFSGPFLLFLACAALNQAAHTVYYAFATLHWKSAGWSDDVIGMLWAEGVIAEILLFSFSGAVVRRLRPTGLMVLGLVAGVIRWTALGLSTALPVLVAAQALHSATFACSYLGAMHFLQRGAPPSLSARAQALFSAGAAGLAPGLMSPITGQLYEHMGGGAFLVMAGLSAAGLIAAIQLHRRWSGGVILSPAART